MWEGIKQLIEHNDEHFIELTIFGKTIRPCARCFGTFIGMLISFPVALLFYLGYLSTSFTIGFIASWMLALPAILDWSSVKLGLWSGNNRVRVASGALLGSAILSYFLVMPAGIFFKFVTYLLYTSVFSIIYIHHKVGLTNFVDQATRQPYIYGCDCGFGCCCPCCESCYGSCASTCTCACLGIFVLGICCCIGKFMGGKE